ncbi:hypothetical protein PUN28_003673 [Cardiocondyla obscurior]|uniref:Uncharacterized protein n=1 Tax=Cardiocondyla obscurior TaxID=286306 RepID=A0AAW2GNC0_9HYME
MKKLHSSAHHLIPLSFLQKASEKKKNSPRKSVRLWPPSKNSDKNQKLQNPPREDNHPKFLLQTCSFQEQTFLPPKKL